MSELAAQLVDRVLPHVPIRQWVYAVRRLLAALGLAAEPPPDPGRAA